MTKTRKTRKQKEESSKRRIEQVQHLHVHTDSPTYTITGISTKKAQPDVAKKEYSSAEQADAAYLRHDIISITAASGIILAFDALLLILLASNTLHLNFLGY
jgi:hypothetical protein